MPSSLSITSPRAIGPLTTERRLLALDALTRLTRQFADAPSYENVVRGLLLVLSGQFSVGSAFAWLYPEGEDVPGVRHCGIGRFRDLSGLPDGLRRVRLIQPWEQPGDRDDPTPGHNQAVPASLGAELMNCGVRYLAPLLHQNDVLGVVGLGERLTGKPFDAESCELLSAILNTVTPLLVNTLLFERIIRLSERHQTVLNSVGQGVFVFDNSNALVHVNAAARGLLQSLLAEAVPPQELIGHTIDVVFPEDQFPGWLGKLQRADRSRESLNVESLIARGEGGERVFNARCRGLQEVEDERNDGWVLTLDDITQQRDSENRIGDLERMAEKGVMASGIAHELNNFLGMILGGVELTQIAISGANTEKAGLYLARLRDSALQMERFTAGLMDYGRLESHRESADLNTIIHDVLSFAAVQKRFKKIQFAVTLDPSVPRLDMDRDQIAQLLLNLLNNAGDAISATAREGGRIAVATSVTPASISLIIGDNGAGMPPEIRDKLFKSQLTTKSGGHGYGLITCARIIAGHKGTVDVESEPGDGTRIAVHFPRPE